MTPFFATERGVTGAVSKACRASAGFFATMVATRNEANLNSHERHRGKATRTAVLKRMWRAFAMQKPADANGWADQGDVLLMHRAVFDLPVPIVTASDDATDVWDAIGPYAVSLAIDTSVLAASDPIRKWVGAVAHQGVAWKRKTINGTRYVKWVCPMHPASDTYSGLWVRWSHLRKAAKAVPLRLGGPPGNMLLFELYPAGDWTNEALAEGTFLDTIGRKNARIARITSKWDAAAQDVTWLAGELAKARDCTAAQTAAFDQSIDAIEALKADAAR